MLIIEAIQAWFYTSCIARYMKVCTQIAENIRIDVKNMFLLLFNT
jgi:hypothetical protein